jgi:hypothetical protein
LDIRNEWNQLGVRDEPITQLSPDVDVVLFALAQWVILRIYPGQAQNPYGFQSEVRRVQELRVHVSHGDVVTSTETRERAAATRNPPPVQRQDDLIQREVWSLTDEHKDLLGVLLQRRSASSARHQFASPILVKTLHPPDRGTDADVELLGRLTTRTSSFNKANDADSTISVLR